MRLGPGSRGYDSGGELGDGFEEAMDHMIDELDDAAAEGREVGVDWDDFDF